MAYQVQTEGIEERRNQISNNLLNFYTLASLKETPTKALDQLSTDFECDQLRGDQNGKFCGAQDLDKVVSSTQTSLTDFSNLNSMMPGEDLQKIMTTKMSSPPNLSDTQIGKYDEEFFMPLFPNNGTSLLSSDVENASVLNNKMTPTSGHVTNDTSGHVTNDSSSRVTDDFIRASKLGESSARHLRRFQNTEVERRNLFLLPDQTNQYIGSLCDEQQCVDEVLRGQEAFLKNQDQGHWLPHDPERPR